MAGQALRSAMAVLILAVSATWGCHADDNDPKGQAEELDDAIRREHAMGRLSTIMSQRLVAAKGDRSAPAIKEFNDVTHAQLVKTYLEHPEDNQNGLKILQLMAEMRDPRTLPALLKALEWQAEVTEDHAVSAANTLAAIDIPVEKRGEVVDKICVALKRVQGARGVDNRMRKGFIDVLGKLHDKRATPTLLEIALRQEESQNFLFNKLAVQQLVGIVDPTAVPSLVKALYMFDKNQPMMRMEEDADAALIAIGRPALAPLMEAAKGKNPEVNALVELAIESIRRQDPNAAATLNKDTLIAREAVLTLGRLGYREALPLLLSEATTDDRDRRMNAALALVGITRTPQDTKTIVDAIEKVYEKSDKQTRPQLLVAVRHMYADGVMPFLYSVAKTTETELPPVQAYGWMSYALLANKAEAKQLAPILDREELIRDELKDYRVTISAADECDESVQCWVGKLGDKNKIVVRKAANMLGRYGRGDEVAINALVALLGHADLEVRNEALSAIDVIAVRGSQAAVKKIDELQAVESGRSIWNNFSRQALPARSRLQLRAAS